MNKVALSSLLLIWIALLSSCSSTPAIVGRWNVALPPTPTPPPTETPDPNADALDALSGLMGIMTAPLNLDFGCETIYPTSLEFFKDGTFTSVFSSYFSGKYEVLEGGRVKLDTVAGISAYDYTLSGNTLTIAYSDECKMVYQRAE